MSTNLWLETWRLWRHHPRERVKLVLGSVFHPRATREWLRYVRNDEWLWREAARFPQLVTRIYRPYALRQLSCRDRVAHMIGHHELLQRHGLRAVLQHSLEQPMTLLTLPTKSGDDLAQVQLLSVHGGHREGEKHLQFLWNGAGLYTLSFLLRQREDRPQLVVTRLQGSKAPGARDAIRLATKGLHGCRPTVMLVQLARQFALGVGCQDVLLLSNHQRVALNPLRRRRIRSDLEGLWHELGACANAEGFFALPALVDVPDDFSEVASNKRSEARRRAELLRQGLAQLTQSLDRLRGLQPNPIGAGARDTMVLNSRS